MSAQSGALSLIYFLEDHPEIAFGRQHLEFQDYLKSASADGVILDGESAALVAKIRELLA